MDVLKLKEEVERKIRAGEKLDEGDLIIFSYYTDLTTIFYDTLINSDREMTDADYDIFYDNAEAALSLPEEVRTKVIIKVLDYCLKKGKFNVVKEMVNYFSSFNSYYDEMLELLKTCDVDDMSLHDMIPEIVEVKRFDLLEKLYTDSFHDKEIYDAIKAHPEYDQSELPPYIMGVIQRIELMDGVSFNSSYTGHPNVTEEQAIATLNYIKSSEVQNRAFSQVAWYNVVRALPEEYHQEFFEAMLERGFINEFISLGNREAMNLNADKMIECMKKNPKKFVKHTHAFPYELLENEEFVMCLINVGQISDVLEIYDFEKYIPSVIEALKVLPPDQIAYTAKMFDYPEMVEIIFDRKLYKHISFGSYSIMETIGIQDLPQEVVRRLVDLYKDGEDIKDIISYINHEQDVCTELIESKQFEKLKKIIVNSKPEDFQISDLEIILEHCKEDFAFSCWFISNFSYKIIPRYGNTQVNLTPQAKMIMEYCYDASEIEASSFIENIIHIEDRTDVFTDEFFEVIKPLLANYYHVSVDRLEKMYSVFGGTLACHIENSSIMSILLLSGEDFDKFMDLFPKVTFSMQDLEMMYDAIMQKKFHDNNKDIIEIFANIKHSLDDGNTEYIAYIKAICDSLDERVIKRYNKSIQGMYATLDENGKKKFDLLRGDEKVENLRDIAAVIRRVTRNLQSSDPDIVALALSELHVFTDFYVAKKREEHRASYDMVKDLELPLIFEEKSKNNYLVEFLIKTSDTTIIQSLIEKGMDPTLARAVYMYYTEGTIGDLNVDIKEVKANIKNLKLVAREWLSRIPMDVITKKSIEAPEGAIKKIPVVGPINFQYQFLEALRMDILMETVLGPENEEAYASLKRMMDKYKLHLIPDCMKKYLQSQEIVTDYSNLASIISFYTQVLSEEEKRLQQNGRGLSGGILSFNTVLAQAESLSAASSVYAQILTSTDARLIKSNPGPNSATMYTQGDTRLSMAVEQTVKNYERKSLTVPSFNATAPITSKGLDVSVGNFTNPAIMTLGERTGACMRIGGAGETLFNFCLTNPNGFHIVFTDPETHAFVSRVSGFRNGNTVFLNELRTSCSDSYTDDEVVDACRWASQELIRLSQNSPCPIENVVCHNAYALESREKYPPQMLGVSNVKEGLGVFYSDVQNNEYVMATTAEEGFVPLSFDKSKVPTYSPVREKVTEFKSLTDGVARLQRVAAMKQLITDGKGIDEVEPLKFSSDEIYGFCSQDWYIYIDEDGIVHEENIGIDERAKAEMEVARKIVSERVPNTLDGGKYVK